MRVWIEQRLLFALPVDIDHKWAQLAQKSDCCQLIVNEGAAATSCRKFPADDNLHSICLYTRSLHQLEEFAVAGGTKSAFNVCLRLSRTDYILRTATAKQYSESVNDDRFTRPGFASEQIKTLTKLDVQFSSTA